MQKKLQVTLLHLSVNMLLWIFITHRIIYRQETVKPGEVDVSGDGQVNFKVNLEEGYVITSVKADQNYKNVKDQGEGIYRVTKITGPVTVTVATLLLWYRRKAA